METNSIVKAAGVFSKPLSKLINVVGSGVGAVGTPLLRILEAHANGYAELIHEVYSHRLQIMKAAHHKEILLLQQREVPMLPSSDGPLDIQVIVDTSMLSESRADAILQTEQQAKRRANLIMIAAEAADEIGVDVSDDPVDPDWVARFFTAAQDVSQRELQTIWGRLLAREVEIPGRVPLRTLDTLRNLTVSEMRLVERFRNRVDTSRRLIHFGDRSMTAGEIATLTDAGIILPSEFCVSFRDPNAGRPDSPFGRATVAARFSYSSGYSLVLEGKGNSRAVSLLVPLLVPRSSAVPLLDAIRHDLDVAYLESVVSFAEASGKFTASLCRDAGD